MKIALINTNLIWPPVAPIGLDYIAEALHAAGQSVQLLDLCWEDDPHAAIARFFADARFDLVGMTLRNTDDCAFVNGRSFLPQFREMVRSVRENSAAPVVVGGVGFSVMPESILALTGADYGVWGEGEFVLPELALRLEDRLPFMDLPGLVWRDNQVWRRNPPFWRSPAELPSMSRQWVDNRRYFQHGGQAGFETRRGCSCGCTYCADPVAKGNCVRLRPPRAVVDELERLLDQGINVLHTCDGEFNIPYKHAMDVCAEISRRGLGDRLRWYAYCAPAPFTGELARAMREAGCAGIDFGADNGDATMLRRLGRPFGPGDILNATRLAKERGMVVMLDLLLGAPGESRASVERTVTLAREASPDRIGVTVGVRVYPGTPLAAQIAAVENAAGITVEEDPLKPRFFLEPAIADEVFDWLHTMIGDDERFLFFDPARPKQNYNYNSNQRLVEAIEKGYRGAFWDILRLYGN